MTENFPDNLLAKVEAKDLKRSIRRKYKLRLRNLAATLDEFIVHAEQRLDVAKAGKTHKREETKRLLENSKILRAALPVKSFADEELSLEQHRNFCEIFGLDPNLAEEVPE